MLPLMRAFTPNYQHAILAHTRGAAIIITALPMFTLPPAALMPIRSRADATRCRWRDARRITDYL